MSLHPHQLRLWSELPRVVDPGEQPRCLDCGRLDWDGTWGPPGTDSITLDDGSEHTVVLADQWLCGRDSVRRWEQHRVDLEALPRRRAWLDRLRALEAAGVTGDARFAVAS